MPTSSRATTSTWRPLHRGRTGLRSTRSSNRTRPGCCCKSNAVVAGQADSARPAQTRPDPDLGPDVTRLAVGTVVEPARLVAIDGASIRVPARGGCTFSSAGSPLPDLQPAPAVVRRPARRGGRGRHHRGGVLPPAAEQLRGYQADLPFAVVADPRRDHYGRFGVETGVRSLLDPRSWLAPSVAADNGWLITATRAGPGRESDDGTHRGCPPTSWSTRTARWRRCTTGPTPTTSGRWTNCCGSTAPDDLPWAP